MSDTTLVGTHCSCGAFVAAGSFHVCSVPQPPGPSSKIPHKCPACDGWGKRYKIGEPKCLNTCPACDGKGVVWEP